MGREKQETYYPISIKLQGEKVLVVGGGRVARRKVESLLACGARVHVVSPQVDPVIQQWAREGLLVLYREGYSSPHLEGSRLVIGAAGDPEVNRQVARDAGERDLLVNVVDDPGLCSFLVPATLRRGSLALSVSTGGKSPALAARIRRDLEGQFGQETGPFLDYLGEVREKLIKGIPDPRKRRKLFRELSDPALAGLVEGENLDKLKEKFQEILLQEPGGGLSPQGTGEINRREDREEQDKPGQKNGF